METQERQEVREMIHGVLSGWEAATIAREELLNVNLTGIKEHLVKLNGSVAKHEGIINGNLPHTIVNCAQKDIIQEIRDTILKDKDRVKTAKELRAEKRLEWQKLIQTFMFIVAAAGLILTAYFGWYNNKNQSKIEDSVKKEIRMQKGVSKVTRGGYVLYNNQGISDSIKLIK